LVNALDRGATSQSNASILTGAIVSGHILRRLEFDAARVLVIGDVMLDRFRYGSVSRISPEAPVPVMHVASESAMLGGAGNVLSNIAALDCACGLIAVVGDDAAGRQCRDMIAAMGADASLLVVADGRPTTVKTRMISGSQQLLRCDEEDSSAFAEEVYTRIVAQFDAVIGDYNIVAISDYAKGVLSDTVLRHVIDRCGALGVPVIVDPKRRDLSIYAGATVIKPNRSELAQFVGTPCSDIQSCHEAADRAMALTGSTILLTLSEQGMALFQRDEDMHEFHATATEVYDVSGAGDTALAILCASFASGHSMYEAAMLANAGAGAVVRKLGTATLSRIELDGAVAALETPALGAVASREAAARQVAHWRREGLRVGFTNGCFDIVHAGHIALLRQARATCDRLVVGLNADASVSRLKGPTRPIQPEASRSQVLAAIDAVDLVVLFEEDTPLDLIIALRPTELIKGADYTEDQVVGAREVKADGGRVHLVELVPELSTTRAVERIRQGAVVPRQNGDARTPAHPVVTPLRSNLG
jgi:D-beta-D-heptose 7-phosphate kinase/D-beta-D-heptose 1-phosphate adenosyltransferase